MVTHQSRVNGIDRRLGLQGITHMYPFMEAFAIFSDSIDHMLKVMTKK